MISSWTRALALFALAPASALAFEAVDTIPYPSLGAFPEAYAPGPVYPTRVWAHVGTMYDSNPFRLADGVDPNAALGHSGKSDGIVRLGGGVGYTQRIVGRQSVNLEATGEFREYLRFNQLDHFAYTVLAEWLAQVGNDFTATIGYGRARGLADPGEAQQVIRDIVVTDRLFATGIYTLGPSVRARGAIDARRGTRSGDRPDAETDARTLRAGIDYVSPLVNTIGVEVREERGTSPVSPLVDPTGEFADNEYIEREIAVVVSYRLGTQIRLLGRVGQTERSHTELAIDEFQGTTYRARLDWMPTAKVGMEFNFYREPRVVLEIDATHVLVEGTSFEPRWAPTAKLVFSAQFVNERRLYTSTADVTLTARDEVMRTLRLAAGWEPQRHIRVGAGVDYGNRSSNVLGRDYDYVQVMLNARYDW